jgi:hypothetical protein
MAVWAMEQLYDSDGHTPGFLVRISGGILTNPSKARVELLPEVLILLRVQEVVFTLNEFK